MEMEDRRLISPRIFEVAIIVFSLFQQGNNKAIAESGAPNHTVSNTISDILFFIPGVTASLVVFLVFGTTKSWRQYRDLVVGGCGIRRRIYEQRIRRSEEGDNSGGLEFERLPSLPNRTSEDNTIKAERRVRMFVTSKPPESTEQEVSASPSIAANGHSSQHTRAPSPPLNIDSDKPRSVDMSRFVPAFQPNDTKSAAIPINLADREYHEDPEIQSGPADEERGVERHGSRRFVSERLANEPKEFLRDLSD
jgi:hypothetical protein